MDSVKYIGMDVHNEAISIAVLNSAGKLVMESTIETKAITILDFLKGLSGSLHVTLEEGTWAAWLYDLNQPRVTELVVCNPRRNALLKEGSKSDRIVQAPAPSRPIERSIAGPGLLAHVLVSKYSDHLPLYRQSEIYAREGVEIDRSTLAEWVGGTSRLVAPLVEALRIHVMSGHKLHADDTPVPVRARPPFTA
jgi:hypothetical protein